MVMKRLSRKQNGMGYGEPEQEQEPQLTEKSTVVPELSKTERRDVVKRARPSAIVVHETVREEGERELRRSPFALAMSALAAGLSMGFSLIAQGLLYTYIPAPAWRPLLENLGYSLGFLIVVLGRQQLFTENTITVILPLLAHPDRRTFMRVIFAGWLIALMVWLLPATDGAKMNIIIIITYIVALGGFAHIIAGSVDVLYLVNLGTVSWLTYLFGFMLPTLIGNVIGGCSLVAVLNFAQVAGEKLGVETESGNGSGTLKS